MTAEDIVKRLRSLKKAYYDGSPIVSDQEFDSLEESLRLLDPDNGYFRDVGSRDVAHGDLIHHAVPMLSMGKSKDIPSIFRWLETIRCKDDYLCVEPKIDGLSATCRYTKDGKLDYVATRGDGTVGRRVKFGHKIADIPNSVKHFQGSPFEIRGELYLPKSVSFKKKFESVPLRNACVGIIKREELSNDLQLVRFVAYELVFDNPNLNAQRTTSGMLDDLRLRLPNVVSNFVTSFKLNMRESPDFIYKEYLEHLRDEWEFETDGLIFILEDRKKHARVDKLKVVSHHHHYAIALKPPSAARDTELVDISWDVSRFGNLIPVGILKPVSIGSIMVENVTLNNAETVDKLELRKGDVVRIERANDVIPHLVSVVSHTQNTPFRVPKSCPSCDKSTTRRGVHAVCTNRECRARVINNLMAWINQNDMKNIGRRIIEDLYDAEAVRSISDLYSADIPVVLSMLPGYSKDGTRISKIQDAITGSRHMSEIQLMGRIGIPTVGVKTIRSLNIGSVEDLIAYRNVAVVKTATEAEIRNWVADEDNAEELKRLRDLVTLGFKQQDLEVKGHVCITGTFTTPRLQLIDLLHAKGYEYDDTVSKQTSVVLVGSDAESNSKYHKAVRLGIKLVHSIDEL